MMRSRGCTRTSRGESTATSRSIVRPPVAAASGAPDARPAGPSARVIDPPLRWSGCGSARRGWRPAETSDPWSDHRVVRPDVTVQVLVGPAEPLRIEPLVVAHRPNCRPKAVAARREPLPELAGWGATARPDLAVVERVQPLRGHPPPATGRRVRLERESALDEPARQVRDVVGVGPAVPVRARPLFVGHGIHRCFEVPEDALVVAVEAVQGGAEDGAGRLRIGAEGIVPDLAGSERVRPRLEDSQVIDR